MLFQSQFYVLVFLPVTVGLYYAARSLALRQWILIVASLVFYGWWDARFVVLPLAQIAVTWLCAWAHERTGYRPALAVGIAANLLSLGTFKYLDFLLASVEQVTGLSLPRAHLVLPLGISFFTFQLISYLADRWRGEAPLYPLRPFALFVLLFPHLIAGPIVRHNQLMPQLALDPWREGLSARISAGLAIFTVGFAKKVLLADKLATFVDPLYSKAATSALDFGEAWTAALGFSFQLFLDFSAYTEMAIGSALLFGLLLPDNFRQPYIASDIAEFWRRWHITLSNFLRDYLYIPLGGDRRGPWRYVLAVLITMGLCGLWHGAGWTFVAWGLAHGVALIALRAWQRLGRPLPGVAAWALTMSFILVGWVLFRASSFAMFGSVLASLTGSMGFGGKLQAPGLLTIAALVSLLVPSAHDLKDRVLKPYRSYAVATAVLAIVCVLEVGKGAPVNFIYFQF